jgi:hypothetical protein
MCQARVSNKSVLQECFRVLWERGRERVCVCVSVCVLPECATRVASKSVRQECLTRSHKSVPQECPTRVCHKRVTKECPTRLSEKSVKQECSARVAFNAIEHLLFAFHCSVGTLLLRELLKNAFGSVASIRFFCGILVGVWWDWLGFDEIKWNLSGFNGIR